MTRPTIAIQGRVLTFHADPAEVGAHASHRLIEDGLVVVARGRISAVGEAGALMAGLPSGTPVADHSGKLVMPGLIDTHIHYPQTKVIASYGAQLLEWLRKYTFVEEQRLADPTHAAIIARFFFDELLRNGTTTACVYCTVHPASVEAFFAESERRGTRMAAGKVMMDRNAPPGLLDTPQRGYDESEALIARWHGRGRQRYAISPRFAITSTEEQLAAAGALARAHADCHVQTHLCETHDEIAAVRALYPNDPSYTAVYARHGLLGPKTILGHCIHLEPAEVALIADHGAAAAFCPTSNLFLGSGLFDRARLAGASIPVGIATDVGGGTSYSMLRTAAEGYKVLQLNRQTWSAFDAFHMLTRGNAAVLGMARDIGTLEPGREADVVVLDARATPAMAHRMESVAGDLGEELFILMTLGDDRCVTATYVAGALSGGTSLRAGATRQAALEVMSSDSSA